MTGISVTLPDDLRERASSLAEASGVSLDQFIATAVATRVGAMAETMAYFRARGARTTLEEAEAILAGLGQGNPPRSDDAIED